jgi:hypothetical protein
MSTIKNPTVNKIFDDLDDYRTFCSTYGYRFNEADLYDYRNYVYRQYQKSVGGKPVKNQWEVDLTRFKEQALEAAGRAKF